jgi:hypothetical protein
MMKKLFSYLLFSALAWATILLSFSMSVFAEKLTTEVPETDTGKQNVPDNTQTSSSSEPTTKKPLRHELKDNCIAWGSQFLCLPQPKFDFEPRITTGVMNYSYVDGLTERIKGTLPVVGFGMLIRFPKEKLVVDIYAQRTAVLKTGGFKESVIINGDHETDDTKSYTALQDLRTTRKDYSVNVGYQIDCLKKYLPLFCEAIRNKGNLWIFGGYKINETVIHGNAMAFQGHLPEEGVPIKNTFTMGTQIHLDTSGFFGGLKYQYPLQCGETDYGVVGINVAYAKLSGDYSYENSFTSLSTKAQKKGITWGIDWERPLDISGTDFLSLGWNRNWNLNLNVSVNLYRYNMEVEVPPEKADYFPHPFSVKERIYTIRAGFILQFP